jgi:hypothetical protein
METVIWVVLITTLIAFCSWRSYKLGFKLGYKHGAETVLDEWKKFNESLEDELK